VKSVLRLVYTRKINRIPQITYCFCSIRHHCSHLAINLNRDRRGRGRMIVGFITTYAISAYHH